MDWRWTGTWIGLMASVMVGKSATWAAAPMGAISDRELETVIVS